MEKAFQMPSEQPGQGQRPSLNELHENKRKKVQQYTILAKTRDLTSDELADYRYCKMIVNRARKAAQESLENLDEAMQANGL